MLSDGIHFVHGMMASQVNSLFDMDKVREFTVVQLKESLCNTVQNNRKYVDLCICVL